MWKGLDVSDNQGAIDWAQVAAANVAFAILRSVRRSGKTDHHLLQIWKAAESTAFR